jgi:GNAT superfamily N-acetyltransferase
MATERTNQWFVRDAEEADMPALIDIKGEGSEAFHRDRLRDAQGRDFRYLVLLADTRITGFACLVFRRPASWSDADDTQYLPHIVDLQVKESERGKGYGSALVRALEDIAAAAGHQHLYLSVDPVNNPRAHALYQRLAYRQPQSTPHRELWEFQDSDGRVHRGEGWAVDMVKLLHV